MDVGVWVWVCALTRKLTHTQLMRGFVSIYIHMAGITWTIRGSALSAFPVFVCMCVCVCVCIHNTYI